MSKKLVRRCLNIAKSYIDNNKELEPNKHFSFIIQGTSIISIGLNKRGHVPTRLKYNSFSNIHSEVDAYKKAKPFLKTSKRWHIINIRLNNAKETMLAAPCVCCTEYLKILGCNRVIYSDFDNKFIK